MHKDRSLRIYIICYLIVLIPSIIYLSSHEKGDFFLWVNAGHNPFYDLIFKYTTFLGDGAWFAILAIIILFFSYYYGTIIAVSGLVQLVVIQGLKRKVFPSNPRPAEYFKEISDQLHFVDGVEIHHWNSFPSGHTATAFGLATLLVLLYRPKPTWTILIFVVACLAGFSRIYLSQHFLQDVVVGSLVGIMISTIVYSCFEYFSKSKEGKFFNGGILPASRNQK